LAWSAALVDRAGLALLCTDERARIDDHLEVIVTWLLDEAYWTAGRDRSTIERSMDGSRCFGVFDGSELVGFARVITDDATFVWICDVFIATAARGRGIGTALVEAIVEDYATRGVLRFLLGTRDAHEVYARAGFTPVPHPERYMTIDRRPPLLAR
jgi:GNAT superfamily N-acetyltransferase